MKYLPLDVKQPTINQSIFKEEELLTLPGNLGSLRVFVVSALFILVCLSIVLCVYYVLCYVLFIFLILPCMSTCPLLTGSSVFFRVLFVPVVFDNLNAYDVLLFVK